ncbi:unnamed protein product [Didymodactylos carnosus]|uniref:Uncharacterized protein n=1 Tax=Didymodactylos carnosus TaxID=1234261 RepID=A0A8S2D074_9BILA|nr:unnamed protein product [Didymodactylos carnosus]CAF3633373.1 unnamed protein product [Didymodactylos carnosus]
MNELESPVSSQKLSSSAQQTPRLLYVDALNYGKRFFRGRNHWNVIAVRDEVDKFVTGARQSGYEVTAFLDAEIKTKEAHKKWRRRREDEVRKGWRDMPQGFTAILGDAFIENGIKVLYSLDADGDDTLAAYAQEDGADILSADQDFFRYVGHTYSVYTNFVVRQGKLTLKRAKKNEQRKISERLFPANLPKTQSSVSYLTASVYERGAPSPLVYLYGNPHVIIRPLRQALYARLQKTEPIKEIFPVWNWEHEIVDWTDDDIVADPWFDALLERPYKAVKQFFPKEYSRQERHFSSQRQHRHYHCRSGESATSSERVRPTISAVAMPVRHECQQRNILLNRKRRERQKRIITAVKMMVMEQNQHHQSASALSDEDDNDNDDVPESVCVCLTTF